MISVSELLHLKDEATLTSVSLLLKAINSLAHATCLIGWQNGL